MLKIKEGGGGAPEKKSRALCQKRKMKSLILTAEGKTSKGKGGRSLWPKGTEK